jgi:3-oxoacyl-[acyl-carrier protein] reductase
MEISKHTYFDMVLGGSSEIGLSIITKLSNKGRNVLFTYNSDDSVLEKVERIKETYHTLIIPFNMNILKQESICQFYEFVNSNKIQLSSIIYSIGKTKDRLFSAMSENDFNEIMDINLKGCFKICKLFINNIAVSKGNIVIISSISGLVAKIGQANYSCSKSALIALGRNLAAEYAKLGVKVNIIAPGFIKTKMLDNLPEETKNRLIKEIPLRKIGAPEDVSNMVYYLVSEDNTYITGQTIIIDGGLLMR